MKQTEIGLIPDDWEVKRLGDVTTFLDSKRIPITESERKKGIYPYYGASGIIDYVNNYIFDGDYVLLGEDGANIVDRSSRLAFVVHGKCWINNHAHVLHPNEDMDLNYLSEYLESLDYTSYNTGTAQPKLNREKCNSIPVIKPPLAEQQRIAKALSDADALISTTEKLIQKKKNIKQGTMQNLLTGKKRLPGFGPQTKSPTYKQTELGPIPEDWEVKTLGELGSFKNGISKPSEDFGFGSPFVNLMDIFGITKISETNHLGLINSNIIEQNTYSLKEGDVLFIRSSVKPEGVGLTTVIKKDLDKTVYSGFILRFREIGNELTTDFKEYVFYNKGFRDSLISSSTVSANTNINQPALKKLIIVYPSSKEEQTAIANVLSCMDKEIETLNTKLEKYRNLKTAMMQQLLTGKIRL